MMPDIVRERMISRKSSGVGAIADIKDKVSIRGSAEGRASETDTYSIRIRIVLTDKAIYVFIQ